MAIKCPKCQHENPDGSRECGKCSSPLKPIEEFSATKTLETPVKGLTSGTTFATRYEVIEELGKGGMGRVYKALDNEINEEVAIKLLKPEISSDQSTVERFRNELKFARRIAHKNVCKMYHLAKEKETRYITMEYVPGEDLKSLVKRKGKLEEEEAVSIAKQVCEGLVEAHRLGVVHRDLKPQNIMIDEQGDAKIMDFGIARSVEAPGVTVTGMMIGTPDYISPEQAGGEEADQRSDIYSLGAILYEMVTGSVPFKGDTALSVALKHKSELPPDPKMLNPKVSDELNKLILICMEKDRERRYQTAAELLADLNNIEEGIPLGVRKLPKKKLKIKWKSVFLYGGISLMVCMLIAGSIYLYTTRAATIHSIAVLPFENLTGDTEQEYIVDGMTDELIGQLGRIGALQRVISRKSVMKYKRSEKSLPEIAQELNVDAVVEGTVQKLGGSVSIRVRLIKVFPEERSLWEETYDRTMTDVLVMNCEVAQAIAREIRIKLTAEEETHFAKARNVNPETYGFYLKGMSHLDKREFEQAISYFDQAVEKDPSDPLAYAGMAMGYAKIGHDIAPTGGVWPRARAAALRAIRLDETLAEGHSALADVKAYYEWDWEGAEQAFKRADELNANLSWNHYHYSWYLALLDRKDEAVAEHKRAQEIDPLSPKNTINLGLLYWMYKDYDEAIAETQKGLEMAPDHPLGLFVLGTIYASAGMFEEAIAAHKRLIAIEARRERWRIKWPLAHTYVLAGRTDEAREILAEVETKEANSWNAFGLALVYAALGEKDKAFEWLDYEPPHAWVPWVRVFPWFESLWDDPRFEDLLNKMNLPPLE